MRLSRRILLALSITALGVGFVAAQPQPVGAAAYARVGGSFFIHGGATYGDNLIPQFWALDLTKPWTVAEPIWKSFNPGPYNAFHTAGYSSDNNTFITFGRDSGAAKDIMPATWLNVYNIKDDSWSVSNPSGLAENTRRDFSAVTNPTGNKIYILGGNAGPQGAIVTSVFDTYDVASKTLTEVAVPSTGPTGFYTYAGVWIDRLSVMLVIGGQGNAPAAGGIWMYTPSTGQWSTQVCLLHFVWVRHQGRPAPFCAMLHRCFSEPK